MPIMKKTLTGKDMSDGRPLDKQLPFTPTINIAIETDDGNLQPPEIDDHEETFQSDEELENKSPGLKSESNCAVGCPCFRGPVFLAAGLSLRYFPSF